MLFSWTETKVGLKDSALDSEELTRGPDSSPVVASQPPRVALFPGVDASVLKVTSHEIHLPFPELALLKRLSAAVGSAEEKRRL